MKLIDTHAHISYRDYSDTVDNIINSAIDNGVEKIISVGTDLNSSEECVELAEKYPCVYATCGYHPHEAKNTPKRYLYELEQISSHPKVVAIGEIGLDYHYNFSAPTVQKKVYREQLEMSKALSLPAVIHCRKSDKEILTYIDFQTTIWSNIGVIGYGIGFNKNMGDDSFRIKTKSYLGYMLLYNYEKEKNSDYVDRSLMFVIPIPFEELINNGEDYDESYNSGS